MSVIFRDSGFSVELENESEVQLATCVLDKKQVCAENRFKLQQDGVWLNKLGKSLICSLFYPQFVFGKHKRFFFSLKYRTWTSMTYHRKVNKSNCYAGFIC
jgi:hypothetical protein